MRHPVLCLLLTISALALLSAPGAAQRDVAVPPTGWIAVYKHDGAGRALSGDKAALIAAVRRGQSVRVGWGMRHPRDSTRSVEHTAAAEFTTIVDDAEVFVQVTEHVAFADYWARETQAPGDPRVTWTGVLGTPGTFQAVWYNRATGTEVRRLPQRVTMTWFVQGADASGRPAPPPLYSPEAARPGAAERKR
jgi:hypothetical protein